MSAPDCGGGLRFHVKRGADRARASLSGLRSALLELFLLPLRAYRLLSSPLPRRCKYEPTCSAYAEQAVRELGIPRGTLLAAWRVLRCNPLSHGGWDPVSERRIFRPAGPVASEPREAVGGDREGREAPA